MRRLPDFSKKFWPGSVREVSIDGSTPVHLQGAPFEMVELFVGAWPESVLAEDAMGLLPLYVALLNDAPLGTISYLAVKSPVSLARVQAARR